ncbi:MAG: phosphatase PAP2 family protein [Ktedonobacterales bacterium]
MTHTSSASVGKDLQSTPFWRVSAEETEADAHLWKLRHVLIGAALWLVGAALLALLSVNAHRYPEFPLDEPIAAFIQGLHQPALQAVVNLASDANWPTQAGITAIAVIVALALLRHIRAAICAAISGFGADFVNVTLNGIVARPRPNNVHIHVVAHLGLHSFPSGHVTHVIAFYGFLLYFFIRQMQLHPAWRPWLWAPVVICVYFIMFIGPSRVLEGEHWPSDVLASYLIGALVLTIAIALYHLLALAWLHYHTSSRKHALAA